MNEVSLKIMKKIVGIFLTVCLCVTPVFAQKILTAKEFFQMVSENYGTIKAFEADVTMTIKENTMEGHASFKRPNLLRIDFTNPDTQVIVFNGDVLTIYLPGPKATLTQVVGDTSASTANLATPQGLQLMSRYYSISYETGPEPVPFNDDAAELVVNLILERRNFSEGFRTIKVAINSETKLIRRVEATSISDEIFVMEFTNYTLNPTIPDTRFMYDAPSSANNYNNFLFSE